MKKYIVFYDNWVHKMDIYGFFTCDSKYKKKLTKKLKKYKEKYTFCIGSNKEIYYENGKAILDSLISKKELKVL